MGTELSERKEQGLLSRAKWMKAPDFCAVLWVSIKSATLSQKFSIFIVQTQFYNTIRKIEFKSGMGDFDVKDSFGR